MRGLVEAIVPGVVFLGVFTATQALNPSLVAAVAVAAVFTVARLAQRTPLTQALAGLVGVVVCAFVARTTGEAKDYYVPGFYTNAAYGAAMLLSIVVRWPFDGPGLRVHPRRGHRVARGPARASAPTPSPPGSIIAVFALRLAVQLPLYFADTGRRPSGPPGWSWACRCTRWGCGSPGLISRPAAGTHGRAEPESRPLRRLGALGRPAGPRAARPRRRSWR